MAGSLHHARLAGVSSEVVSLVGGFCKVLVTRAFGEGVTMPADAPDLGKGSGPTIAYWYAFFGLDYWIYSLLALGKIFLAE